MLIYLTKGKHIIADCWGVQYKLLNDCEWLVERMVEGVKLSGANIVQITKKEFEPSGVTILILLEESHMSCHTYPDESFIALDCYTCGDGVDPCIAVNYLISELNPIKTDIQQIIRGEDDGIRERGN